MIATLEHVSDLLPDLPRLRTIEKYLLLQLAAVQRAIEKAENGRPETPKPVAGYGIHWRRSPPGTLRVGVLHRADCWVKGGGSISHEDALTALTDPVVKGQLEMCEACHPRDTLEP